MKIRGTLFGRCSAQRGAATLMMALAVLVVLTVLTIISAEVATVEQRSAANDFRARQALEGAITGYEHALAHLGAPPDPVEPFAGLNRAPPADGNCGSLPGPQRLPPGSADPLGYYAVEFCDATVDTATGELVNPLTAAAVSCEPGIAGTRRLVYARGWSDDCSAVHHVVTVVERAPAFAGSPSNPVTTRGTVYLNGSGDVTNPEGRLTIWAGQSVEFNSNTFKTNILAPTVLPGEPGEVIESSNLNQDGPDVVDNDGNLSILTGDEYFANFMGYTPDVYRSVVGAEITSNLMDYAGGESFNKIIWATPPDGDTGISISGMGQDEFGSLGDLTAAPPTPPSPTVIVVDGDLRSSGNATINGLLYVRGNLISSGNFLVRGSLIVEGEIQTGTGSFDVIYNGLLVGAAQGLGRASLLPGSWKDWVRPDPADPGSFF